MQASSGTRMYTLAGAKPRSSNANDRIAILLLLGNYILAFLPRPTFITFRVFRKQVFHDINAPADDINQRVFSVAANVNLHFPVSKISRI